MDIWSGVKRVTHLQSVELAPATHGLHDGQRERLPVEQWWLACHHYRVHEVAVFFNDARKSIKIPSQNRLFDLSKPGRCALHAGGLKYAGFCRLVTGARAYPLMLATHNCDDVHKIPMVKLHESFGVRRFVRVARPPLDIARGNRTRPPILIRGRANVDNSRSASSAPCAATPAKVNAAKAEADDAIPAPMGKLLVESTWANKFISRRRRNISRWIRTRSSASS